MSSQEPPLNPSSASSAAVTPSTPGNAPTRRRASSMYRSPRMVVAAGRQVDAGQQHAARLEAWMRALRVLEAPHEQSRADQRHHRQRDLADDEADAKPAGARVPQRHPAA